MNVTIIGATGFLGQNLIRFLQANTSVNIRAFARSANKLPFDGIQKVAGSIFDAKQLDKALRGADAVIYLLHMMGTDGDFYEEEQHAARRFAEAARRSGIKRVIYMGGLGKETDNLSKHLASRHETGRILRESLPLVIELRASMIIAKGSVGYDIIRSMTDKLPVLMVPRWADTRTQPILLDDALHYLAASLVLKAPGHQIVEIGGPERLSYRQIVARYAKQHGRRPFVLTVPLVPRWAAVWWLTRFTSHKNAGIGGPMFDSLRNEMIADTTMAGKLFPAIHPRKILT